MCSDFWNIRDLHLDEIYREGLDIISDPAWTTMINAFPASPVDMIASQVKGYVWDQVGR
jgi:hypothetical protein